MDKFNFFAEYFTEAERFKKTLDELGTGFDYWLGNNDADTLDMFKDATRFEVSGVRHGDDQAVDTRVNQKLKQTTLSSNDFPVVVIVVEFGRPQAKIATH